MKVLIVGGAGFIGSTTASGLIKSTNFQVVSIDNLSTISDIYNLEPARRATSRHQFYIADAANSDIMEKILRIEEPDVIIFSIELDAAGNNAVRSVANDCQKIGLAPRVLVVASHPAHVGSYTKPASIPDFSYLPNHTTIFTCRVFGPREHSRHFLPATIYKSLGMMDAEIKANEFDTQEWLYVGDLFKAILLVISSGMATEEICVSSGLTATEAEIVGKISKITGGKEEVPLSNLSSSVVSNTLNSAQLLDLGWTPTTDLDRALEHTVCWFSENQWALR